MTILTEDQAYRYGLGLKEIIWSSVGFLNSVKNMFMYFSQ